MTRNEFIDEICDWYDLIDFANNNELSACECIYSDEDRNNEIENLIRDYFSDGYSWQDIRDRLNDFGEGYDYWEKDDWGDWEGMNDTSDFDRYKEYVIEEMDDRDYWDPDPEEDDEEYYEESEEESEANIEEPVDDGFSLVEFYVDYSTLLQIDKEAEAASVPILF